MAFTTIASLNTPRTQHATISDGAYVYVFGGSDGNGYLQSAEKYDPGTDSWSYITDLPSARQGMGIAFDGTYIYLIGGYDDSSLSDFLRYDTDADSYTTMPSLPEARYRVGGAHLNGNIYAIGGYNKSTDSKSDKVFEYDISTNLWDTVATLSEPRDQIAGASTDSHVYAVGGNTGDYTDKVEKYDQSANSWTTVQPMIDARQSGGIASDGTKIYMMGGYNSNDGRLAATEYYTPADDTWTSWDTLNTARTTAGAGTAKHAYVVSGYDPNFNLIGSSERAQLEKLFAPSDLTASQGSEGVISLSWTDVDGEDGYYVYRATSSGSAKSDYTRIADLAANTTTYDDTGLLDGEKYYYRVSAYGPSGESDLSGEASATTYLPPSTSLSASNIGPDSADLSWVNQEDNATEKRVYLRETGGESGMDFEGSNNDYIDVSANASDIGFAGTGSKTAFVRIRPEVWSGGPFQMGTQSDSNEFSLNTLSTEGQWRFQCWSSGDVDFSYGSVNETFSLAFAYDGPNDTVYIYGDGSEIKSAVRTLDTIDGKGVDIGQWDADYFDGNIFEVAFYDRLLSASEISNLHNGNILTNGLVGYWPLDINRSGTTPDLSPQSNDGIVNGATLTGPSVDWTERTGMKFVPDNQDYVTIPDVISGLDAITLTTWLKNDDTGHDWARLIGDDSNNFRITKNDGTESWRYEVNDTLIDTPTDIVVDTWQFWSFVYDSTGLGDGNDMAVYLNGSRIASKSGETSPIGSGNRAIASQPEGNAYIGGIINDMRVYNRSLSSTEISNLYNGTGPTDGLTVYWPLTQINSGTTPDHAGDNDGTINGDPYIVGPASDANSTSLSGLHNGEEYEAMVHTLTDHNEVRDN